MAGKRKKTNGYDFPERLPENEVLEDLTKEQWILGPVLGKGGFGEIYLAKKAGARNTDFSYVIKIEPHANGPLFVERKFYMSNAQPKDIEAFKKKKGLTFLGIPSYIASGSHEYNGNKYRFLVMERFGADLWKIFEENGKKFPIQTAFKIAVQLLDVIEYVHSRGYAHADIKPSNILLSFINPKTKKKDSSQEESRVFLVDFGLASKLASGDEFKPDPKRAHDGTLDYLSRDAHKGVQTRRGDLEILAYNLIQWLSGSLPWESVGKKPKIVMEKKEQNMADLGTFMKTCFKDSKPPEALIQFLKYIQKLDFNTPPDYGKIRKMFLQELEKTGDSLGTPLKFTMENKTAKSIKSTPKKKKVAAKKNNAARTSGVCSEDEEEEEKVELIKKSKKKVAAKKNIAARTSEVSSEDEEGEEKVELIKKSKKKVTKKTIDDSHDDNLKNGKYGRKRRSSDRLNRSAGNVLDGGDEEEDVPDYTPKKRAKAKKSDEKEAKIEKKTSRRKNKT